MQPGTLLRDAKTGDARFRIDSLLTDGKSYQVAIAHDTHMDDKQVCVKVIDYDVERLEDKQYIKGRRDALGLELEFLTQASHLLPEPLDLISLAGSPAGDDEPALVYEYQHGKTLLETVQHKHPHGMPPARALSIIAELAEFCSHIHDAGYIFRDFDPRHVIVGFDDVIHVVGCGNAVRQGEKMNVYRMTTSPCYTAPEIRKELSGKVVRPACDVYSLGCLLSFLLTGVEPTPRPESPLDVDAFDALQEKLPVGYRLIVARCLQALSHKRFKSARALLDVCSPEKLPTPTDEDFSMVMLPTPWSGPEGKDNRALRSRLSQGPLISVRNTPPGPPPEAAAPTTAPPEALPVPAREQALQQSSGVGKVALVIGGALVLLFLGLVVVGVIVALGMAV